MATNDELMPDTKEFETPDDGQADASAKTFEDGQALADTQPLDNGQASIDTQPLEGGQALADTQVLVTVSSEPSSLAERDAEALESLKKLEAQRKESKRKHRMAIFATCAVAVVLIGAWAVSQFASQSSNGESAAATAVVKRSDLTSAVQTNGIVLPGSVVNVSAEVSGVIDNVVVSDGQKVQAGDVLFTLRNKDVDDAINEAQITLSRANRDVDEARAGVSQAEAEYSKALKEHEALVSEEEAEERKAVAHAQKVYQKTYDEEIAYIPSYATKEEKKKLIAEAKKTAQQAYDLTYMMESPGEISEFDDSFYQASIDAANSAAVSAEEYASDLQRSYDSILAESEKRIVRAPVAGTVVDLVAVKGATVGFASGGTSTAKSDTLAKIADLSRISVDVEVSEVDISSVEVGQRAVLTFAGVPDLELAGRVDSIASVSSNISDGATSLSLSDAITFKVTVVADVSDSRLKPGMAASVRILTKDEPNVLVVPAGAIEEENGVTYVTVAKNDKATETERREVVIADRTSHEAAIASGLEEGEIVIDRSVNTSKASESSSSIGAR